MTSQPAYQRRVRGETIVTVRGPHDTSALNNACTAAMVALRPDPMQEGEAINLCSTGARWAHIDTSSNDFCAGLLFALTQAQRELDQPSLLRNVAEAAGLNWEDAERLLDPYDLDVAAEVFDREEKIRSALSQEGE